MVKGLEEDKYSKIEQPHLLLVEGKDDALFMEAFLKYLNRHTFEIWPLGRSDFKENFAVLRKISGFSKIKSIGVVRDADLNPEGAFQSVCSALNNCGIAAPTRPGVPSSGTPIVRIMIMPDENSNGMIETLCMRSVRNDPVMPCVESYFKCLQGIGKAHNRMDKARIHVYLASREDPSKRLGESALAGYWPFESEIFDSLKQFLLNVGNI